MEAAEMQSPAREAGLEVDARKQQMIGVTYGEVRRSSVEQTIRTVGTVAYDESALTDVTLKFHGWIEGLRVDRTGDYVREGEILFSLYSPELVQTQEDYLTSFEHLQRLGRSPRAAEASRRMEDLLAAVRRRLDYWDVPENHVRDLEQDRRILRSLPIHSPAGGYVIEKHVTEGAHVQAGHLLYRLADLDAVWVLADVYEHELPRVAPGQEARVTLSYLPGETFVGKVGYVYPYLDPKERTVKVRIELANPGHRLRAGMYADVELRAEPREVLVVPAAAVLDSGERRVVFVAAGPGRFEPREIESGARFDDAVEVLAGLEVGERIVTSANFLLDSESQLASGMRQMSH
ncbi:MAG: efflux RND transporter periplasmic adaptor subunit [Acidobacteria bacterium]|nr:efflux RND transporter periplasmic adaptor subunit [Acidobacteriota bacterium]